MGAAAAYIEEFLVESNENLSSIGSELLNYEKDGSRDVLDNIYRKVHTLKGSAGFLGFKKLQKITHTAENILDLMRENKLSLSSELVDALLKTFDICTSILQVIADSGEEGSPDVEGVGNLLESLTIPRMEIVQEAPDRKLHTNIIEDHYLLDGDLSQFSKIEEAPYSEPTVVQEKIEKPVEPPVKEVAPAPAINSVSSQGKKEENLVPGGMDKSSVIDSVVRVNVNLLDKIMNLVGELVLSRNQIMQFSNSQQDNRLMKLTHDLNVITSDLQTEIMNTRMQPVGNVLSKFERLVRDLSRSQKKSVQLSIVGQDTELDRTLLEAIKDPLTHIIRNSMDHGLETPEERTQKGKNPKGQILIRAFHEGGYVAIEIKDDGRGINKEKVLAKALEKGVITEDQASSWTENQIHNLIFNPGFSTADKVTNISGRGVGMDVVKTNIEKVGGNVIVESVEGQGSKFKLQIPLTLAIIPALIVKSLDQYFAIPQLNLAELLRIDNKTRQVESIQNSEFLRLRDELIPIVRLNESLNIKNVQKRSNEFNGESVCVDVDDENDFSSTLEDQSIIVMKADGNSYGLVVDEILDTEEIVVKPLDQSFKDIKSFAGATLMGDGRVALILDPLGLWVKNGFSAEKVENVHSTQENILDTKLNKNELLLFSLADGRKYGIPISSVYRLEEFPFEKMSKTGTQVLVKYNNKPMPLVNIEKSLGYQAQGLLENNRDLQMIKSIVIKSDDRLYGLVVYEILDICLTSEKLSTEMADRAGVSGTIFIDEETITVLEPNELIEMAGLAKSVKITSHFHYQKFKIAVAEDSQLHQKLIEDTLKPLGVQFDIYGNGREALKGLMDNDYDLLLTDIEMPEMNGFDLVKEVKATSKYMKIPTIAVTTRVSAKDLERGKEVGIDTHLEKLNKNQVREAITNYLDKLIEQRG